MFKINDNTYMNILITGCCGFIGFSLAKNLLDNKTHKIYGIDSIDNYYNPELKFDRLKILKKSKIFFFEKINIKNKNKIKNFFLRYKIDVIFHFAAQAGVRYSFVNPQKYLDSNIIGFFNILDNAKNYQIKKIVFASSSSVYGDKKKLPVSEIAHPSEKNLYAISKNFNEKLSKVYSEKYNMKIYCLRFFSVYGEWGRPDMFMLKYINASLNNKKFILYNFGNHKRDFTYIGDVISILKRLMYKKIKKNYEIFNICSSKPINLHIVINEINKYFLAPKIMKMKKNFADVLNTHGSNKKLLMLIKKIKFTPINKGIYNLCNWYKTYYKKIDTK